MKTTKPLAKEKFLVKLPIIGGLTGAIGLFVFPGWSWGWVLIFIISAFRALFLLQKKEEEILTQIK